MKRKKSKNSIEMLGNCMQKKKSLFIFESVINKPMEEKRSIITYLFLNF